MRLILSRHSLKAQNFPSRKHEGTKTKRKLAAAKMIIFSKMNIKQAHTINPEPPPPKTLLCSSFRFF